MAISAAVLPNAGEVASTFVDSFSNHVADCFTLAICKAHGPYRLRRLTRIDACGVLHSVRRRVLSARAAGAASWSR
jgi:hypothetical protein